MDITSANSAFVLQVPSVFTTPQALQGYATDDAFTTEEVDVAEVMMGVDGIMSGGFIPFITQMNIVFQADSVSITNTMEVWISAMQSARAIYLGNASIQLPSINKEYILQNGILRRITPTPPAKKVLMPQTYAISWQNWSVVPL